VNFVFFFVFFVVNQVSSLRNQNLCRTLLPFDPLR